MREQKVLAKEFEFYFPELDNMMLVETLEDGSVRARFTKDNLSEKWKISFIRRLAAEGFIPDGYQWFSESTADSLPVAWRKDYSWIKIHPAVTRRAKRVMCSVLIAALVFWMAMIRVMIVSAAPHSAAAPPAKAANPPARGSTTDSAGRSLGAGQPLAQLQRQH